MTEPDDRISTLNPEPGKAGQNIERWKYDRMRSAILAALAETGDQGARFMPSKKDPSPGLMDLVVPWLGTEWTGSVGSYVTTVKLDLEARGEIERVPASSPQRVRLASK